MENLKSSQISGENIDHLGLVAGVIKKTKLIERIDKILPIAKEKGAKVTMGERVSAMILNALGFVDNRLYMFAEFLSNKPIKRLLGSHLSAQDFTDDSLGRCLDQIYEYGTTQFVSDITFQIASQLNLLGKTIHVDSTSLSVYGDYDELSEKEAQAPQPTYGFSKDKRADLKQLILNLAVTNKADLPIFMASHSGNASDQKILIQATKAYRKMLSKNSVKHPFLHLRSRQFHVRKLYLKEDKQPPMDITCPPAKKSSQKLHPRKESYRLPIQGYTRMTIIKSHAEEKGNRRQSNNDGYLSTQNTHVKSREKNSRP